MADPAASARTGSQRSTEKDTLCSGFRLWRSQRMRLGAQAARGRFHLQHCNVELIVAQNARHACRSAVAAADPHGRLVPKQHLRPAQAIFSGTCTLACWYGKAGNGVPVMAHLTRIVAWGQGRTASFSRQGRPGCFHGLRRHKQSDLREDIQLRELTNDPRHRRVLITDARSPAGCTCGTRPMQAQKTAFASVASWKRMRLLKAGRHEPGVSRAARPDRYAVSRRT